jgi:hypothetical protein
LFVRKCLALLVVLAACSKNPSPGAALPGAVAPRQAVVAFLAAVKAQDLQAMSTVWGDEKGPARERFDRTELEKRLLIMQGCYDHERYQILDETPRASGVRIIRVSLVRGNRTKTTGFEVWKGPSSRYFVNVSNAEFSSMQKEFCPR